MKAVVQRVIQARVDVEDQPVGEIARGLLIYLGIAQEDNEADVEYLVKKIRQLRIFTDHEGKLNLDVGQVGGQCLVVSAFTVQGDVRKGNRPDFSLAASPTSACGLYEKFCAQLRACGVIVATGEFQAKMKVHSVNDGPVCILLDSRKQF